MTQHPEDPSTPDLWFHRFGVALYAPSGKPPAFDSFDDYDAWVYRLGEADGPEDLTAEDRARFEQCEREMSAGGNAHLQYEHRGDWAAEDAAEDAEDAAPQVKADGEDEWVGL